MDLLNHLNLEKSSVVANCQMNRERGVVGINSYAKDLKINILDYLSQKIKTQGRASWLDLGCGVGKALLETAEYFYQQNLAQVLAIQGIDLVDLFVAQPDYLKNLNFRAESLHHWQANQAYDLITAVHSLHYVGDKLAIIQKATAALQPKGLFLANLAFENLKLWNGDETKTLIIKHLKQHDIQYNSKLHLLRCEGKKELVWAFEYLGADDQAGANYTGQAAVNSYYQIIQ
jgi:cyclopropane fatty-acyl-phospholipid synthase-like methyltransferase